MKHILAALFFVSLPAFAGGMFGNNTLDDMFTVKKIEGKQATLEGASKGLKAGDLLYFARSPFKFTVTGVAGNQITIALPEKQDLAVGNNLMRKENDQVKKAIETESKLKQALEE
ncbi:MAG: hypothetical protein ACXVB9_20770 [Bdellovibrionota bacterium]